MPIYDKEKYESYIHSVMDKPRQTKAKPDAPSPIMTPNNMAYYGSGMNQNQMFSHENMMDNVMSYKPSNKDEIYNFSGFPIQYPAIPNVGTTVNYRVDGWSKRDKDYLDVSVGTKQHIHGLDVSGNVEVKQNGQIFSSDKLKYSPHGYIYETGGAKPLGEARVKLPTSGKYDVNVNVFGLYNDGTGRHSVNYTKKLPYGK